MNISKKILNIMKNGGLFIVVLILTFKMFFLDKGIKELIKTISNVNLVYITIGVLCMIVVVLCEAVNIFRSLKIFKEKSTLVQCIQYSFAGIFFSSVTPAATGGQPMQLYFMHKRKIDISNAMLALLICLASYQFVTVSIAILAVIMKFDFFKETLGNFNMLLFLGIGLNVILLVFILIAIFSKRVIFKCVNLCSKILNYFSPEKSKVFSENALIEIEKYKKSAQSIKNNKMFIVKTVLITTIEIIALHSIPFWVYKAFGMSSETLIQFICIQATLYITGAALPLPGAVGIGEGGFLVFFKTVFPANILSSAMLISRGISFYLMIVISGLGIVLLQLKPKIFIKKFEAKNSVT